MLTTDRKSLCLVSKFNCDCVCQSLVMKYFAFLGWISLSLLANFSTYCPPFSKIKFHWNLYRSRCLIRNTTDDVEWSLSIRMPIDTLMYSLLIPVDAATVILFILSTYLETVMSSAGEKQHTHYPFPSWTHRDHAFP